MATTAHSEAPAQVGYRVLELNGHTVELLRTERADLWHYLVDGRRKGTDTYSCALMQAGLLCIGRGEVTR